MFCKEQVSSFLPFVDEIHALGAELVFVGNGAAIFARAFREDFGVTVPILIDTDRASYQALGFRRDTLSMLNPRMLLHGRRAMQKGFTQKEVLGDARQLGGVVVFAKGGAVAWSQASEVAGEHPDPAEVVAALRAAVA